MNWHLLKIYWLLTFFLSPLLAGQGPSDTHWHGRRSLVLTRTGDAPVLDGRLDDDVWQNAKSIGYFIQKDPNEGMDATEQTEVRALFDDKNLYFGVRCLDSEAENVLATELRRDNPFENDDSFAIILDTFHDHRNAFLFRINPLGTQYDALITDEGRDRNVSWDEKWEVETQIDEYGWYAEIRIPLQSLRYSSSDDEVSFGVDFERVIRRRNEFTYWNNFSRDFQFEQVSQAGHLSGLENIGKSLTMRIKPYVSSQIVARGGSNRDVKYLGDIGLEDLKLPLTSGLTLDLTLNTDFAQTEVDDQIINFDRVPVFFPEKREFFLEGAGIFEFGVWMGEGDRPQIKLYHSRRIGLSAQGEEIPMRGGVKVTGKVGDKFTLGFLEAQMGDFSGEPSNNFSVFRLKRDILSRSFLGMFATNRQAEGGDFNRVIGIDQNLVFFEHLEVVGMLGRSLTDGVHDNQLMGAVSGRWTDDLLDVGLAYWYLDENFATDLGFLGRPGTRKLEPRFSYSPRPVSDTIRKMLFSYRMEDFQRIEDGQLETRMHHFNYSIFFQNGSWIRINPHHATENLIEPLRLPGGLRVPPGRYSWWYFPILYVLNPAKRLSGQVSYRHEPGYYGGTRNLLEIAPVIKLSSRFSTEISYSFNQIQLETGAPVNFHQVNNRINFAFSRKWLTSASVQYNSASDVIGMNFRLNYIYRPGDDFFIVYNDFRQHATSPSEMNRSISMKFTHSFDF
ncbi:MAG: DUF5916 domain-containing protein [Acidobacteriota bacterium]|nr:DUF5916 domain-containing protein [Acidobacteriota bacterium]